MNNTTQMALRAGMRTIKPPAQYWYRQNNMRGYSTQGKQNKYRKLRALIFPGQGSQFIGMGKDIYDGFGSTTRLVFEEADEVLGFRLSKLMFSGDANELKLTKNAQPAIVTVSVAILRALEGACGNDAANLYKATMGHSVGEYSALVAANVMSFRNAIKIVRARGIAMQHAADASSGDEYAMCACILRRANIEDVFSQVEKVQQEVAGEGQVVQVANVNSSSQIVLSGTKTGVAKAVSVLQLNKLAMRAINLPVSAPFHCSLMEPAAQDLERTIKEISPINDEKKWKIPVISNVMGKPYEDAQSVMKLLVDQVANPVLWLQSMEFLRNEEGVRRWGAMGPGNVVGNLAGKEYAKDTVRRLSDAAAIKDFVGVLERQEVRGY